jgi:prepilin-type N-terminal cleavage/methylation domain-containing protein
VNFHKSHGRKTDGAAGFTLVEVIVAISVLGIGIASTVGALTKFNSIASMSRNATGAYSAVMNQIDSIQSMSPFNPQKSNNNPDCDGTVHTQIPKDYVSVCASSPATYDMTVGTHTYNNMPVYQDPTSGVIVVGTMTVTVTDISATIPNTYQFLVTITYTYLSRNYSFSMSTLRTSDI